MSPDPQPRLPRPLAHASLAAMAAAALLSSSCATQPFGDQKGKPIAITADSLAKLNRHNLDAIQTAISEDLNPKEQPAK